MVLCEHIKVFSGCLVLITGVYCVRAWTYHYNTDTDASWNNARQWCQAHFTDMVAIQNQEEVAFLNQLLPFHRTYYWIGIRKTDSHWTWVGTKKRLVPEAANWAANEPNNQGAGEDCVEIYIKRDRDTAKWNDEKCSKKKATLCYLASCADNTCSEHAECVETIGNYTCKCDPGFTGPRCEEVVRCLPVGDPQRGLTACDGVFGKFHFNSSCQVQCDTGYELEGAERLRCLASGHWDNTLPVCKAQQCSVLMQPSHASVNCTHPHGQFCIGTVCEISCQAGFRLHGTAQLRCMEMGKWTDAPPVCLAQQCPLLSAPESGWMNCSHPHSHFSYGSHCLLGCENGFELTGRPDMECSASGNWSQEMPSCTAVHCEVFSLSRLAELGPPPSMNCSHPRGSFTFGSRCFFRCPEGHVINGTSEVICTSKGYWTDSLPSCHAVQMSLSAGMLMYAAVGAASAAGLFLIGGLMFLLMHRLTKKGHYTEEEDLNLAFEIN